MIEKIREDVRASKPLIHSITNPISITQCANAILATGARPIMAEHPSEVSEITKTASALMLNLGNITDVRMSSMRKSILAAKETNCPVLLDAVGVACSELRRSFAFELMNTAPISIIKGNYSEIFALYNSDYRASGVDGDKNIDKESIIKAASALAEKYGAAVLASGSEDIITDGTRVLCVENGTPQLASITGTGCMLGALASSYLSVAGGIDAAFAACALLGISGELARTELGGGSFFVRLMDNLYSMKNEQLLLHLRYKERNVEKF